MTLIITHINRFGIVHAADSNMMSLNNRTKQLQGVSVEQKLFQIPFLNAAVSVAGNVMLGEESMSDWMPIFIEQEEKCDTMSLQLFAENLRKKWFAAMTPAQLEIGNWAHISGYVQTENISHPECWFVSNILNQDGLCLQVDNQKFHRWEDLATRDCRANGDLFSLFSAGHDVSVTYINGYLTGRILMNHFNLLNALPAQGTPVLRQFVINPHALRTNVEWQQASEYEITQFNNLIKPLVGKHPSSLEDTEDMVKTSMDIISKLFQIGENPVIGGDTQVFAIPAPANIAKSLVAVPSYDNLSN